MHEVHPPHQSVHNWKDFLIHIAEIALGLLMALGLEQTVEHFHHRHQSEMIESQMRTVFQSNLETDAATLRRLGAVRTYLIELQTAISERLQGRTTATPAPLDDRRLRAFVILPGPRALRARQSQWNGCVAFRESDPHLQPRCICSGSGGGRPGQMVSGLGYARGISGTVC